ncbi:MAG: hypothetical protein DI586_06920 [Micavibrio aeruginosavorus]|uniref:Acetylglutamate kinase n=1 Tax=Micavibrio aeruginosavorus TaxID=349221 RepID=A0A2W5FNJ2_9BACT|nr:MAG: hypothetical protein DI586_06920 [Micavibrio aeruginosavorus]
MNHSSAPTADDITVLAMQVLNSLPDEIAEACEELGLQVEEFPDETLEAEMELETPYELLALYKSGREVSPGVEKKIANDDDILLLFRRPILDLWCETGDDLASLVREVIIEEIARSQDLSESDIAEMLKRYNS